MEWKQIFGLLAILFTVYSEENGSNENCELLYSAAIDMRDHILYSEFMEELYSQEIDAIIKQIEQHLGISSIDDDDVIKQLACRITGAKTMSELASIVNIDEDTLKFNLGATVQGYNLSREHLRRYAVELPIFRDWVQDSGFPDTWPLTVTKKRTLKFLESVPYVAKYFVTMYGGYDKTDPEIAKILMDSTSLRNYLKAMDLEYLLNSTKELESYLSIPRYVIKEGGMEDMIAATRSYMNGIKTLIHIGLQDLP